MNTTNTFLRFFHANGYEKYMTIASFQYDAQSGLFPKHPATDEDLDYDRNFYSFDGKNYVKIP